MNQSKISLSSRELLLVIQQLLISSGYLIQSTDFGTRNFTKIIINKDKKDLCLFVDIRNVCSAFIPGKPYMMRRQVGKMKFEEIPKNLKTQASMLLAVGEVNGELVLVCWNPFYYLGHATNRSCYVLQDSLEKAIIDGLYNGEDCKVPVLVCNSSNIERLLQTYIERNALD